MPELPELEVLKNILSHEIVGKGIVSLHFIKPYILKNYYPNYENQFPATVIKIERIGKYISIYLKNNTTFVIHLMKSGRIHLGKSGSNTDRYTSCYANLSDGRRLEIKEYGSEKMAKLFFVSSLSEVPGLKNIGIDPFDPTFTVEILKGLLYSERSKLKIFLKDQSKVAGIGNAYSDEILWEAKLSPFKYSDTLNNKEISLLHVSVKKVLKGALKEIKKKTKGKLQRKEARDFLNIYRKKGEDCPRCSSKIEWVFSKKNTSYYCPLCQTGGKIYKDRRVSHFLK